MKSMANDTRVIELPLASVRVRDVGHGPVILMTPDCPNVIEHNVGLQDALARERRVVCFDMPGFGLSRTKPGYDFGLAHGAQVVLDLMDALAIDSATLSFSCANGFYAMAAALRAPKRIARLVLAQTPSTDAMQLWGRRHVPRIMRVRGLGQAFLRVMRKPAVGLWYRMALPEGADTAPMHQTAITALDSGGTYRLADMVQGLQHTKAEELAGLTVPTHVVWGEADRTHAERPAESLRLHAPHAEVTRLSRCGHFPDLEAPEEYARVLLTAQ